MRTLFSPAWKKRYDFTERVFDEARSIIAKPEVVDALADKAVFLTSMMDYVTPRPVHDGEIEQHADDSDSLVYTVSLAPGEAVKLRSTKTNSFQVASAAHVFGEDVAKKFMIKDDILWDLKMGNDTYGLCKAVAYTADADTAELGDLKLYSRGRPTVALRYDTEIKLNARALTLLHEVDHAANHMAFPIQFAVSDDALYLRSELSAYATQSSVARALGITDERYMPHQVEDIRREFNGDISSNEAFVARAEIVEKLSQRGLSYIYQ